MHKSLDSLLPTNRAIVDRYLMSLVTVDQILCDVLPCVEPLDDVLAAKVAAYIHAEEEIMEQKLQALDYEIDGPDTLGLIIGESQIERVSNLRCLCHISIHLFCSSNVESTPTHLFTS